MHHAYHLALPTFHRWITRCRKYTLYDLMAKYELEQASPALRGATLQLNVNNVADKHYVASCGNTSACFYGSGRSVIASLA
ncbi:MAG: TonB-dependent receptor [Serratia rubidaea]|nr:TonB-dependent receptor [Serratia rubidaea]MCR0998409.1 TonB-dependent receptor [Serratia rubidaea]